MNITDGAKSYIENMMKEAGVSTLRFGYAGAGCYGPSYELSLDEPQDTDVVNVINDVEVAVDPQVVELVSELTLDFQQDEQGEGLVISSGGSSSCC
jgi:HesB-like selenoprotein